MWSEEKSLYLIHLYQGRPMLWDPKDGEYFRKPSKNDAWQEIGESLGVDPEECKSKIASLLASYRREKSKVKKGQVTGEIYRSRWFAYEALAFLGERGRSRKLLSSSVTDQTEEDSDANSEQHDLKMSFTQPMKLETRQEHELEHREENYNVEMPQRSHGILISAAPEPTPSFAADEECDHFVNFIGSKMKKYLPHVRNAVERAITDVIFKADDGYFDHNETPN